MKYVNNLVVAKPDYCVPAVLQMVLEHYGILMSQDEIANSLNIIKSDEDGDPNKWGAQIGINTFNEFFTEKNIALEEETIKSSHIFDTDDFCDEIEKRISKKESIICGYTYTWLFGEKDDVFKHVSIIVDINISEEKIVLIDPGPKDPGVKEVDAYRLFQAMKQAKAGLWIIKKKDTI